MARLRALFRRETVLRDIEEELRVHVEMETETNIKRGATPDEARAAALKSFGDPSRKTELGYDIRGGGWLETLWQDLRYGARMLMKNSGFTLIAIITLALAIGANSAIFSIINATVFKPLPFANLDRIVMVWERAPGPGAERNSVSVANYLDWREQSNSFVNLAICMYWSANLSGIDAPERVRGYQVSPNLLDALGVKVALGRNFLPDEDQPGKDNVVISERRGPDGQRQRRRAHDHRRNAAGSKLSGWRRASGADGDDAGNDGQSHLSHQPGGRAVERRRLSWAGAIRSGRDRRTVGTAIPEHEHRPRRWSFPNPRRRCARI
jgi:hypothetical protein